MTYSRAIINEHKTHRGFYRLYDDGHISKRTTERGKERALGLMRPKQTGEAGYWLDIFKTSGTPEATVLLASMDDSAFYHAVAILDNIALHYFFLDDPDPDIAVKWPNEPHTPPKFPNA